MSRPVDSVNLACALTGLFMAAFMAHVRRKQLKGADKLIEDDKRNYDNVWNDILSTHTNNVPSSNHVIKSSRLKKVVFDWRTEFDVFKTGAAPPGQTDGESPS